MQPLYAEHPVGVSEIQPRTTYWAVSICFDILTKSRNPTVAPRKTMEKCDLKL